MMAEAISPQLARLAVKAEEFRTARRRLMDEAVKRAMAQIAQEEQALEKEVLLAIDEGNTVTDVARAYTPPGSTPNRTKIYQIIRKYESKTAREAAYQDSPFRWVARKIDTVEGEKTVFDLVATLVDFGPSEISGVFTWTYIAGELEPVVDFDQEPYPNNKHYQFALQQWLSLNPYPEEATDAPS